jgi:hypothetical protein
MLLSSPNGSIGSHGHPAQTSSDAAPQSIMRGSRGIRLWLATLSEGLEKLLERAYL